MGSGRLGSAIQLNSANVDAVIQTSRSSAFSILDIAEVGLWREGGSTGVALGPSL